MAKYIIDLPEKMSMYLNVWKCEDGDCVLDKTYTTSDLRPYIASESYIDGLSKGKKEVWEFVNTVYGLSDEELYDIFPNGCPYEMTYQEAKAKYEAWKTDKDKIRVGDELTYTFVDGRKIEPFVVLKITEDVSGTMYEGIGSNTGKWASGGLKYQKTGRHFNSAEKLLEEMRGE